MRPDLKHALLLPLAVEQTRRNPPLPEPIRIRLDVAIAKVRAAGGAEEALGLGAVPVGVGCCVGERRGGKEGGLDAGGEGGVEDAEGSVGVAANGAVAEVDGEGERGGGQGHGEADGAAFALGC